MPNDTPQSHVLAYAQDFFGFAFFFFFSQINILDEEMRGLVIKYEVLYQSEKKTSNSSLKF